MKVFTRTLIILGVALLIVGGMLAFGQSEKAAELRANAPRGLDRPEGFVPGPQALTEAGEGAAEEHPEGARPGRGAGAAATGERPPDGFGRNAGTSDHYTPSLAGLVPLGNNLLKIAVIASIFALGALLFQRLTVKKQQV
ncbi:MAG: hypothetical protein EI684_12950 [Candidatus Viridilinea halotolerans]|uniref:Uncharacterized protein n=1 Tax=Candidatus Viridilinea halotolerans TaxID=2491704 RepID=A0A426TXU5_9CHLR|nr:MAG: hypothetical protein EI684_12950 [Candidatus Viridilinea halotolerans]